MSRIRESMTAGLESLATELDGLATFTARYPALARVRADLAAARFHINRPADVPPILAILGGTGTGKSTLMNRLLQRDICAASVRRTYTAGAIAILSPDTTLPENWLGMDHRAIDPNQLPARGEPNILAIVQTDSELTSKLVVLDTPDLDGDQPVHHAQADRVFRWADAVLFVVTPEKYQMTELLPYYRMARRYGVQAIHAMNKAEEQVVVDDYAKQMASRSVFSIGRDDSNYSPPPDLGLDALRTTISQLSVRPDEQGRMNRVSDLAGRMVDQVIEPMKSDRGEADRIIRSLQGMQSSATSVDVNPLTEQLQRRLQKKSVLYLMGPNRMLERVRQVPGMLARLPRTTWDLLSSGKLGRNGNDAPPAQPIEKPDFRTELLDQFRVVQSRIDDIVQGSSSISGWANAPDSGYSATHLDPNLAGQVADEEVAALRQWLEQKWNATPRDTAMLEKMLKLLPGGQTLTKWTESAPYLLAIVVASHGVLLGHIDLAILGIWGMTTWLTERLSNEVSARAREANEAISRRFTELTRRQIEMTCEWINTRVPTSAKIRSLGAAAEQLSGQLEPEHEFGAQTTRR